MEKTINVNALYYPYSIGEPEVKPIFFSLKNKKRYAYKFPFRTNFASIDGNGTIILAQDGLEEELHIPTSAVKTLFPNDVTFELSMVTGEVFINL